MADFLPLECTEEVEVLKELECADVEEDLDEVEEECLVDDEGLLDVTRVDVLAVDFEVFVVVCADEL